jgi:hypothetical protein
MSLTRLQASNLLIRSLGLIPLSNDRGDGLAGFAGHDFGLTFLLRILRISYFFSMAMEKTKLFDRQISRTRPAVYERRMDVI